MRLPHPTQISLARLTVCVGTGVAVAVAALGGGCITEIVPVANGNPTGRSTTGAPLAANGPVATANPGGPTSMTRVAAAIRPLGSVPYDGLTLPIVTPDGRWLVTQTGSIPAWESVLAEPGAVPALGSRIRAFELVAGEGGATLQPVNWTPGAANTLETPPDETIGMLLGRSAGDGWVLVERPNPDASRWIGKLNLSTGAVEWLVQGKKVNAQALLLRNGTLVYTRRDPDQATAELVMRPAGFVPPPETAEAIAGQSASPAPAPLVERVVRRDGWKLCQPLATPDQTMVAVMAIGPQDAQLLAYSTTELDPTGSPTLVAKEALGPLGASGAFQAVTSVEACPPEVDSGLRSTFLLVNADRQRLAVWDPIKGSMSFLPASVAAGARVHSAVASGLVMASPKGMDFWTGSGLPARLVAGSYIPRSYSSGEGTRLICLSPQTGTSAPVLNVIAVQLVAPLP